MTQPTYPPHITFTPTVYRGHVYAPVPPYGPPMRLCGACGQVVPTDDPHPCLGGWPRIYTPPRCACDGTTTDCGACR